MLSESMLEPSFFKKLFALSNVVAAVLIVRGMAIVTLYIEDD